MRKIKFRGKRRYGSKWIEGVLLTDNKTVYDILYPEVQSDGRLKFRHFEVIPETVGQFTGLTDKNGKEIYEGDIIQIHEGRDDFKITAIEWNVKYALFIPTNKNLRYELNSEYSVKYYEIIGNIHDNPSLLTNKD